MKKGKFIRWCARNNVHGVDFILGGIIAVCVISLGVYHGVVTPSQQADPIPYVYDESVPDESVPDEAQTDWGRFVEALIHVESRGNANVVGKHNDVGVLQITPIMVKEANRILKYEEFTLADRYVKVRSIYLFNVVQNYHNPARDKRKALLIWNRYAPESYYNNVMKKYNENTD